MVRCVVTRTRPLLLLFPYPIIDVFKTPLCDSEDAHDDADDDDDDDNQRRARILFAPPETVRDDPSRRSL